MNDSCTIHRRRVLFAALVVLPLILFSLAAAPAHAYELYFGDLHSHTSISDGRGTPADAYAQAKAAGASFLAVSDHSSSISAAEWAAEKAAAAAATGAAFVGIPSYEITFGWGHINAFDVPDLPAKKTGNQGGRKSIIPSYYDWLAGYPGASAQWNHPTTYSREFDNFAYFTQARDDVMNLIEVHNYGDWDYYKKADYDASYVKALDKGWHVMPTANSDTHITDWIIGYESRTVLLANALTAADLYGAMRARRGYATEDKNLRVDFTVNGAVMGAVLDGAVSAYRVSAAVDDPDAGDLPTKLEIVSDNGAVVATSAAPQKGVAWTPTLSSTTSRYYFLRVTTTRNVTGGSGATAWTAPVWTGR